MKQLAEKISQNNNFDSELMNLVAKLHTQLAESKGKKVYGYMKSNVKKTVDEIFIRLADNESIKKMYDLWCEMEQRSMMCIPLRKSSSLTSPTTRSSGL